LTKRSSALFGFGGVRRRQACHADLADAAELSGAPQRLAETISAPLT
jgi:hypothetical protein